jgi:hypothetical protein
VKARAHACVVATALAASLVAGCGGSGSSDAASSDAQEVVKELRSLRAGEIVIKGSSPRAYGPYTLEPGGYVFRFEQQAEGPAKIMVALESKRGSRAEPYELLVDSEAPSGTRRVGLTGKLYVHVVRAEAGYELRFTPKTS